MEYKPLTKWDAHPSNYQIQSAEKVSFSQCQIGLSPGEFSFFPCMIMWGRSVASWCMNPDVLPSYCT